MWNLRIGRVLPAVFLGMIVVPRGGAAQEDPSARIGAGLEGSWVLNVALSDDPADRIVQPAVPPPVPGAPPGERSGAAARGAPRGSAAAAIRRNVAAFSIQETDSTVTIRYPDHDLTLLTDGKRRKALIGDTREVEYTAWWEGTELVVERKIEGDFFLREAYSVQPATGRLHVLTRLEGERLPRTVSFVRVYDAAEPETPARPGASPADRGDAPPDSSLDQPGVSASAG